MPETLMAAEGTSVESPDERMQASLQRAQQLAEEVRQGHAEQFPDLACLMNAITESSWYTAGELPQEFNALYEQVSSWKAAYFHLHLADKRCKELRDMQEGDDHASFEDLRHQLASLVPLQTSFTPDMTVRFELLYPLVHKWKKTNDHLYYGGEAMAVIQDHLSPPDIRKLFAQILALEESTLLYVAYPLQKKRAEALRQFWIENVLNVYSHQTHVSVPSSTDAAPAQPAPASVYDSVPLPEAA